MSKLIVLLMVVIPISLSAQQHLQFTGERIDFEINNHRFSINGIYYFFNDSDTEIWQTILFPFAKNTDSITVKRVYNLTYAENLRYQTLTNAIAFKLHILPNDSVKVNIAYSQNTVNENCYILASTQTWGQALKTADYSLVFDTSVQIDSLSLKPDSLVSNVFYWNKSDFYPKDDFKVWIK